MPASGVADLTVSPRANTRLYAVADGAMSRSAVVAARALVSARSVSLGRRSVELVGSVQPSRPGQRVAVFAITLGGREVLVARATTGAEGVWRARRTFQASGLVQLVVRSAADAQQAAGTRTLRLRLPRR